MTWFIYFHIDFFYFIHYFHIFDDSFILTFCTWFIYFHIWESHFMWFINFYIIYFHMIFTIHLIFTFLHKSIFITFFLFYTWFIDRNILLTWTLTFGGVMFVPYVCAMFVLSIFNNRFLYSVRFYTTKPWLILFQTLVFMMLFVFMQQTSGTGLFILRSCDTLITCRWTPVINYPFILLNIAVVQEPYSLSIPQNPAVSRDPSGMILCVLIGCNRLLHDY